MVMNVYAIPGIPAKNRVKMSDANAENIIITVCSYYGEGRSYVMQNSKKGDVVKARYICMYLIRQNMGLTLKKISTFFNCNYDHTTVIHAIRAVKDQLSLPFDNPYKTDVENILTALNRN